MIHSQGFILKQPFRPHFAIHGPKYNNFAAQTMVEVQLNAFANLIPILILAEIGPHPKWNRPNGFPHCLSSWAGLWELDLKNRFWKQSRWNGKHWTGNCMHMNMWIAFDTWYENVCVTSFRKRNQGGASFPPSNAKSPIAVFSCNFLLHSPPIGRFASSAVPLHYHGCRRR